MPYEGLSDNQVIVKVRGGGHLAQPERCPAHVFVLLQGCWRVQAAQRITAQQLHEALTGRLVVLAQPRPSSSADAGNGDESQL